MAKKLLLMVAVALFSLCFVSPGYSLGMDEVLRGTVTKIEDGKLTIKDFMGVEKTVEPKNPEALSTLKVGDQATVKDGIIMSKDGGSGSSAPPSMPRY